MNKLLLMVLAMFCVYQQASAAQPSLTAVAGQADMKDPYTVYPNFAGTRYAFNALETPPPYTTDDNPQKIVVPAKRKLKLTANAQTELDNKLFSIVRYGEYPVPLLEEGANVNARNADADTPLMVAILSNRHGYTNDEYLKKYIQIFIQKNALLNIKNGMQNTALTIASYDGLTKTTKVLIAANADVNLQGQKNYTAAMWAVTSPKSNQRIFELLLNASDPSQILTQKNVVGKTLLDLATKHKADYIPLINNYLSAHRARQLQLVEHYLATTELQEQAEKMR